MAPTTSEEELEKELQNQEEQLQFARMKMAGLRKEILNAEEDLLRANMEVSRLKEELRRFRLTYPSLCKRKE